ncbi:hypothetical protein AKJ16_DCAP14661 [Drosera capensis]
MDQATRTAGLDHRLSSYLTNEDVNPNVANNGKKRKLPAEVLEELGFRSSKQKCHKETVAAQCDSLPTEMWQEGDNHGHKYARKVVFNADEEVESAHDSNNIDVDSCTTCTGTIASVDSKSSGNEASTSCSVSGSSGIRYVLCSDNEMNVNVAFHRDVTAGSEQPCLYQEDTVFNDIDEVVKHGRSHYISSGCDHAGNQLVDDELEDFLYSSGLNPNMYMLSSHIWNTDEEAQSGKPKPTIDQEFEQYFSSLML